MLGSLRQVSRSEEFAVTWPGHYAYFDKKKKRKRKAFWLISGRYILGSKYN